MGVPTFFLSIINNKNYKNIDSGVVNGKIDCNYFFLDYNGIVYKAYEKVRKDFEGKGYSKNKIEEMIINEVIRYTKYLICEVVKPDKLTYISFDGPAPRAKMVQQRSRRFRSYYVKTLLQIEKEKYGISLEEWDGSANISPGTEFMEKISNRLLEIMKNKEFNTHNKNMKVLLSNSNVPGEGEHKFLPLIRTMRKKKGTKDFKVYLYGSDADLIVLAVSTHKNNMHIIREAKSEKSLKNIYESYEFIDLNIDNLRNGFNNDLTKTFKNHNYDKVRLLNDYIFLTFLVGNDFVLSFTFLKINKKGLEIVIAIYNDIKINHSGYLVDYNPDKDDIPFININFFKELILEISKKEDIEMKKHYSNINKIMSGYKHHGVIQQELEMTPYEIYDSRLNHMPVCSPHHPIFEKYHKEFRKINYANDYEKWKEEYNSYYLNINKENEEEYHDIRLDIVRNYLESIVYTMKYYFQGCPSWTWCYKYRVCPLLSDVYYYLNEGLIDVNDITFEQGNPYTPFQQLMMILPPQMEKLVPSVLRPIMHDDKLLCTQFYPVDFMLDVTVGFKFIYSEAILPEIDEELLITTIEKYEKKLTEKEKVRNTIREKPFMV